MSLGELGPKLHGYCARMTGAVIDGDLDGWLRIAHNAGLDFLAVS
jgi:hypothetical protein